MKKYNGKLVDLINKAAHGGHYEIVSVLFGEIRNGADCTRLKIVSMGCSKSSFTMFVESAEVGLYNSNYPTIDEVLNTEHDWQYMLSSTDVRLKEMMF